ncbi:hypothetical protein ACLOJK_016944 [Asimina triloba]
MSSATIDKNKEMAADHECAGSLEEKISAFFTQSSNGFHDSPSSSCLGEDDDGQEEESADGSSSSSSYDPNERAEFWLGQESLLQTRANQESRRVDSPETSEFSRFSTSSKITTEILSRVNSSGSKLRREVRRAVGNMAKETNPCHCPKPNSNRCAICLRRTVIEHLHTVGYDAALCTPTWKSTREIPGGKHEYIDVIIRGGADGKKEARFVVELDFRAEFEMAKACEEFQKLTSQLPESYVGRPEHLNTLVRVVCGACKRSMRERKIHMGPWRKKKFMQMKWAAAQRQQLPDFSPKVAVVPTLSFGLCPSAVEVA